MKKLTAQIGLFGGTGFSSFMKKGQEVEIKTPYGRPSDKITVVKMFGRSIAFLPRHGKKGQVPAHIIPYKANAYAMKKLGVKQIIAPCATGSLQFDVKPGHFVICDQFIDRTKGREDTYYNGPEIVHIQSVDVYCPQLRKLAIESAKKLKIPFHGKGTVVVIQGPRFSSVSESKWFSQMGWQVVNMTQYPENILAHELGMCYVNISLITDFDTGLEGSEEIKPVTHQEVLKVFKQNNSKLKKLIIDMLKHWPDKKECKCEQAVKMASA